MKISAKMDYACRALLELALRWPDKTPIKVNDIAETQKIPTKFLVHILISLKQLGFVESIRGKSGGYVLGRAPAEIRLGEIFKNFGGLGFSLEERKKKSSGVIDLLWQEIDRNVFSVIDEVSMETLCERVRSDSAVITYEI